MKKIWTILRLHWKEDFSFKVYIPVAILLIILLVLNYATDFEDTYLDTLSGFTKFWAYLGFFAIPYFTAIAIIFSNQQSIWKSPAFYAKALLGLVILSVDSSHPFIRPLLSNLDSQIYLWAYKVTVNLISLITVLLPLFLYYRFFEEHRSAFYGLGQTKFDFQPYLFMLLIMLPIIVMATTFPSFLKQYPMYKSTEAHIYLGAPEWITALTYEFAYGLDFVTVELLFRGFFVIGMMTLLGRKSVLAMCVIYCLLHFGKPAGEAISSVFGGYILGVIAYETRSIWGGIIVHLGIAWMMEIVSFAAKQF